MEYSRPYVFHLPKKLPTAGIGGIGAKKRVTLTENQTPSDFWMTSADRKTHNFAVHVLGSTIPLTSHQLGSLDYYSHAGALDSLKDHRIFVVGEIAEKFVRNIVPHADIWNIQELTSFTYPKTLPTACCGVVHNPRYCSLAKLHYIRDFINRNPPSEWNERAY